MHVVINSNTYKIRIPVVYSLVVYFLHVEIHSMKLKKIYSFAHCLELIKMDLLEKRSADVLYTSDFLCKYIVIIALIVLSILKKKNYCTKNEKLFLDLRYVLHVHQSSCSFFFKDVSIPL